MLTTTTDILTPEGSGAISCAERRGYGRMGVYLEEPKHRQGYA
jgi:hypothetical protein